MPAPTSKYSTDVYVYRALEPLAARCDAFLSPNVVTLLGLACGLLAMSLMALPRPPWPAVVALVMVHAVADCLDGAIARRCDRGTEFGKTLDVVSDHVFGVVASAVVVYKLFAHTRAHLAVRVGALLGLVVVGTWAVNSWIAIHRGGRTRAEALAAQVRRGPPLIRFGHDNSIAVTLVIILGIAALFRALPPR